MKMNNEIKANREFKDSVFTRLFGEKDKLAELYNAVHGTNYTADDVDITKPEEVLFKSDWYLNDLSFTLKGKLIILAEHQSTWNPNMPLRFLLFLSHIYLASADSLTMYSTRLVKIPRPEFIVLYNGQDKCPEEQTLRLSDAFEQGGSGMINLELNVTVYNVNKGCNSEIMSRSRTLDDYAEFVSRVRSNIADGTELTQALEKAVRDCIRDNILREFLEKYRGDVINMISMEFNLEDAQRVWKNDGLIEGIEKGIEKGVEKVAEKMLKRGASIEDVAEDTDLPVQRINEIAEKIKKTAI